MPVGGVKESNVGPFAHTGVDAIVTSAMYYGRLVDFGVKILKI